MAYGKISDKQREILEYIKKEILNKVIRQSRVQSKSWMITSI